VKLLDRLRGNKVVRAASFALTMVIALLAAAIVVSITIDLGPYARRYAERAASNYLERPFHIGALKIRLFTGQFLVEDIRIDGLRPGDRPFFTAQRIGVSLDWTPAFRVRPEFLVSAVEITDWRMLVERWDGGQSFPRIVRGTPSKGPRRATVTVRWLRASRGEFVYEDHATPWNVICRNLEVTIGNLPKYHGTASFTGGTVGIQQYVPMSANMKAWFDIDGTRIHLSRIDLNTDGASTVARGELDFAHWPDQTYQVKSRVNFPRMRQLFFTRERWEVSGDGDFAGRFSMSKDGPDLAGSFTSELAGVNAYRFPSLYGSLRWTRNVFEVRDAGSKFYGGDARFTYSIKPLGAKVRPTHRFDTTLTDVDLTRFTDFEEFRGVRFAGRASTQNLLEWPSGHFSEHRGEGHLLVSPPPGVTVMTERGPDPAAAAPELPDDEEIPGRRNGRVAPEPITWHLPIAGEVTYRYGPDDVSFDNGRFATERTFVSFDGTTAWGERSRLPFRVVSSDWQESDQVLAGIISDFGAPTRPVAFGGRGTFDGVMLGSFRNPRVEGRFAGESLSAFDTLWGNGDGQIVFENRYINVTGGRVRFGGSEITAEGRFSTGYPRDDGGEELDARFRVVRRDVDSLRHAFGIDDYPVAGFLSGDFHLTGQYEHPVGFGGMTIEDGKAYREPFQRATAAVRFDGAGTWLDNVVIAKGTGTVTGAAFVGWNSTYSFNATGQRVPVEQIAGLNWPRAPLTGLAEFKAVGAASFASPRYDVEYFVNDLRIADEPVGQVRGNLALRGQELSGTIDASSPRLGLTGTGRIALTTAADADLTFRFHDSSLDPYVRLYVPKLSPFTTAVATGSFHIVGPLADFEHLKVDGIVDTVDMRLLATRPDERDYPIRNTAPIRISLADQTVTVDELELVGEETRLRVSGRVGLREERIALRAAGDANLGILQGFFPDVRGAGRTELAAEINGPLRQPQYSGQATITNGRIRHFSLPNALDAINGTLRFDAGGIRLDDVSATMGGGRVQFGGRIGFEGYLPGDLDVTARGQDMRLRYPEGIRSVVDMDLSIRGNYKTPTLGGTVTVKNAVWNRRIDAPGSIFDLASRRGSTAAAPSVAAEPTAAVPLRFDVQILVPSTLRIENNMARLVANADLTLRGTYDRPIMLGHADIDRGEVIFEGRRYRVTRGSMEFANPSRIEPFFDVEAETNVRVPGQTYRVIIGFAGTTDQLRPTLSSDPPLPTSDVLALLFSDVRRTGTGAEYVAPELRAKQNPTQTQTDILTARATQAIASPLSAEVGKVVEQTFGVDTFQLTPSLVDPYNQQTARLNPTARLTIGKRISDRVYLTFSRSLGTTINDQIVLLEYEESDRLSWILSRNEDSQTYALEFRVRHVF
jgi:hypothetical protein